FGFARTENDFAAAFDIFVQSKAGALIVAADALYTRRADQLAILATRHALPAVAWPRPFAEAGGLMSYRSDNRAARPAAGGYVGRILKGEKPGDLPVVLPEKFEVAINLKTARTLGVDIPSGLLAIADEVIE